MCMSMNRHIAVETICVDTQSSSFNGMRGIHSRHELDLLNDDAEKIGLTRRWYTFEEYELRKLEIE